MLHDREIRRLAAVEPRVGGKTGGEAEDQVVLLFALREERAGARKEPLDIETFDRHPAIGGRTRGAG